MSNIRNYIRQLAQQGDTHTCLVCQVDAVNLAERSIDCTPLSGEAPYLDVALQATTEGEMGLLLVPTVGSYVLIVPTGGSGGVVVATTDIEQLLVRIEGVSLHASREGITLNEGKLGGLVRVEDLTTRLNKIEEDINSLKKSLATWIPTSADGITLKGKVTSWASSLLVLSKRGDYENERVKQ